MNSAERRYDIDWLRVIAIGLLLIYHIGIAFQPWGVFIGFIQSDQSLESIWPAMAMLNVWRIPLLFFVSGMGVGFAIGKRSWKQLLLERTRRILLPLVFGALFIVPLHILLWQKYYSQDLRYAPGQGHLWFLANIFIYVMLLSPLFFFLKRNENGRLSCGIRKLFSKPWGLLIIVACFILESFLVGPEGFALYATTLHGFLLGLLAFLFGFLCIHSREGFWQSVRRWRWPMLALALAMYLVRYLVCSLLFPLEISGWLKFILVILFTGLGCFVSYELIRRVSFLRPVFGLKKA